MWEWRVRKGRPRIWLDEARLAWLRDKVKGKTPNEIRAMAGTSPPGRALVYLITGDEESARAAVSFALSYGDRTGWVYTRTAAICYDWCYPVLSDEQRAKIRELITREGYKVLGNHRLWHTFRHTFHKNASDLGISVLALEPDDSFAAHALEFIKTRYRDAMRVFEEIFADGEWPEGFDLNRPATGCALRLLWALKTATGDDLMAESKHLRNTSQYIIHCAKPDGLAYPGGDNDAPALNDRDREALLMLAAEFRDPYAQYFLNHCRSKTFVADRTKIWTDLLWYDPSIAERPLEDIPRSRIFRGHGLVAARSGWGWDDEDKRLPASWVTFRCGRYFGPGAHYDNNHFEVYYKGELAIDSGRYDDDWGMERAQQDVRKSQFFNYYRRSIAHNTVLVYDPDEEMGMGVVNDGGQKELLYLKGVRNEPENFDIDEYSVEERRKCHKWTEAAARWETGEVLAYTGNNLFTYACGDATRSYSQDKVDAFVRQFFYFQPDLIVVFDRVVATDPAFRKTWLLHSILEPRLRANGSIEISHNGGRLVCVPVLPGKRSVDKIGGAGKEFLAGGVHFACGPKASSGRRSPLRFGELPGAWRVEQSPIVPSEEDYFLNVLLLTDRESKAVPVVERQEENEASIGILVELPYQRRVRICCARGPKPGAQLLVEERGRTLFDGAMPDSVVLEKGRI